MFNELIQNLFVAEGRLNRQRYLIFVVVISVVSGILQNVIKGVLGAESMVAILINLVIAIGLLVPSVYLAIRRFHDMNEPGTKCWFLLIPFYNFYLIYLLLFKVGTSGANQYGSDRLQAA